MNTSTVAPVEQEVFFKTSLVEIKKGASIFLDVGGKLEKNGKQYLGFSPIRPLKYGGAFKRTEEPILIFKISNQKHFIPEMEGERWEVRVDNIEITSQLTSNKQFQRVLVYISVIKRVEHAFRHYNKETEIYTVGVRSGRATITQNFFETEEEIVEYRDERNRERAVRKICNVYAQIGDARELVYQIILGGVIEPTLVLEKTSELFKKALQNKRHGDTRAFKKEAEAEVKKYLDGLPEMPRELKR